MITGLIEGRLLRAIAEILIKQCTRCQGKGRVIEGFTKVPAKWAYCPDCKELRAARYGYRDPL